MPIHSDPTKMEEGELIYALDIGTRSVIGMLGALEQGRIRILALEKQPHARRAMLDGQIEDIDQVAGAVSLVTHRLEEASGRRLTRLRGSRGPGSAYRVGPQHLGAFGP